jgi:hypothetical protein
MSATHVVTRSFLAVVLIGSSGSALVVGQASYQRFLTVMTECTRAQLERRKL